MTKVYIIHGWESSPKEPSLQWLKTNLEDFDFSVEIPAMPNPSLPRINTWLAKLDSATDLNSNTILVGHSIGCQAILRFLQSLPDSVKIRGIVLLAPWMKLDETTMAEEGPEVVALAKPWLETPVDWKKIKTHISQSVCIFSDNDPYVPQSQQDFFADKLGSEIIIEHKKYHFDRESGTTKLPSVLESVVNMNK